MHSIRWWARAALFCMLVGCWQEIEYRGPAPTTVGQRRVESPIAEDSVDEPPAGPLPSPAPESALSADGPRAEDSADERPVQPTDEVAETAVPEPIRNDGTSPSDVLVEQPEAPEPPAGETNAVSAATSAEPPPAAASPATSRHAAWRLGSKLSLAALAHDRGLVPEDVAAWLTEARAAAASLGTGFAELPEPAATTGVEHTSNSVHDYLFQQGQRIWRDLTDRHGADHATLFEVAVKSNVLLVLYEPGSAAVDTLASSLREAATRGDLPPEFWQPLLDAIERQAPPAQVRAAVRRLHDEVDKHLSAGVEPDD